MSHVKAGGSEADALSTSMRFLIHYTGDVHQPLHAMARVDNEFPAGDRGGNSFPVKSLDGANNLHAVWDSVVYGDANDFALPLKDSDWNTIGQLAAKLVESNPTPSIPDITSIDPAVWAKDSFEAGEAIVYENIAEN